MDLEQFYEPKTHKNKASIWDQKNRLSQWLNDSHTLKVVPPPNLMQSLSYKSGIYSYRDSIKKNQKNANF